MEEKKKKLKLQNKLQAGVNLLLLYHEEDRLADHFGLGGA